jgi:hypothetical protein
MFFIKTIACISLALALSGCDSDFKAANRECRGAADVPAWDGCIEAYNARAAARRQASDADTATMLLMGATAFTNGYNQARPQPVTCWNYGPMTQCQ